MATSAECLKAIEAAAEGRLSDEELVDLIEQLSEVRERRRAQGKLDSVEDELFDEAGRILEDVELGAQIEKRNRLRNIVIRGRVLDQARQYRVARGDASMALEAALVGVNAPLPGSRFSADHRGKGLLTQWQGGMIADLESAGLARVYSRGDLDDEVWEELWDLSLNNPTGRATTSKDAKAIAKIINKYLSESVLRENRAGSHIRFRQGRAVRQTHDRARMEKAGKEAWINEVAPRLDWETMRVPDNKRQEFLSEVYDELVTGVRKDAAGAEDDLLFAFKGPGNLAKKESASRVLLFGTARDAAEYNKRFGQMNLREAVFRDLERAARNTALMETFGTNPRAMFDTIREDLKAEFKSDPDQVRKLNRSSLDWFMAEVDGSVNHTNNHSLATVAMVFRAVQSTAKLGGAFISAIADIAASAAERRYQGRNLGDAWGDAFMAPVRGMSQRQQKIYGRRLGVGIEGTMGGIVQRVNAQDDVTGLTARMMAMFFKLNLLGPWTDATKRGIGLMMANDMASWATKGFDALPAKTRRMLAQYNINAEKWEIARQLVHRGEDGRKYLLPSEIENLDIPQLKGRKGQRLKDEIREGLSTFITDRADAASPTPGARERAYMRLGLERGTIPGEVIRTLMQFKSFPITVMTRVLGRDIRGHTDGADILGLVNFIAGGTVLGYFAMQAKELAKGREPRKMDRSAFVASMLQGGGLGIYGDFLLGETNRFGRSMLDTVAGPGFGTIADLDQIRAKIMAGEDVGATIAHVFKSNLPGGNLFYTKAAFDYLIWYQLQETLNPGYLRRMERRVERDQGQRYLMPPSRAVPRGGGSKVLEGVR